jgi:hypothetical protein
MLSSSQMITPMLSTSQIRWILSSGQMITLMEKDSVTIQPDDDTK